MTPDVTQKPNGTRDTNPGMDIHAHRPPACTFNPILHPGRTQCLSNKEQFPIVILNIHSIILCNCAINRKTTHDLRSNYL